MLTVDEKISSSIVIYVMGIAGNNILMLYNLAIALRQNVM